MNEDDAFIDHIANSVESVFNADGGDPPYALRKPNLPEPDAGLGWFCSTDQDGRLTSVFVFERKGEPAEKKIDYLTSIDEAKRIRGELVNDGWVSIDPPKISFTYKGKTYEKGANRHPKGKKH